MNALLSYQPSDTDLQWMVAILGLLLAIVLFWLIALLVDGTVPSWCRSLFPKDDTELSTTERQALQAVAEKRGGRSC